MNAAVHDRLIELIAVKADIAAHEVNPDSTLEDLGLDSLHLMEMALWALQEYGLDVPEGDLRHDQKVREMLAYFSERIR